MASFVLSALACLGLACLATPSLAIDRQAQQEGSVKPAASVPSSEALLDFDIPSQSVAAALERYTNITHVAIVFSSDIARGRTSTALKGRYSPDAALQRLLDGTGLIVERHDPGIGETLLLKESASPATRLPGMAALLAHEGYAGLVQSRLWQVLCGNPQTRPGQYRLLLQFQIEPDGRLARLRLLAPTGSGGRDAAVLHVLQRVQVEPPPAPLAGQSLIISLLPEQTGAGRTCTQEAS